MSQFAVWGAGVWGVGLQGISELKATLDGADRDTETFAAPKPEAIPARERRRAGLLINLAVQVAEALEADGIV